MAQTFLSNNHAKLLRADFSDERLRAVMDDHVRNFTKDFE